METHIEELKRIMNESLNIKGRADQRAYITQGNAIGNNYGSPLKRVTELSDKDTGKVE